MFTPRETRAKLTRFESDPGLPIPLAGKRLHATDHATPTPEPLCAKVARERKKKPVTLCREASGSVSFAETSDGCNHDPRRDLNRRDLNLPLHHLAAPSDPSYGRQQPVPD